MERNDMKGKPTWLLESQLETAKVIEQNTHDAQVKSIASQQIDEITQELARRGTLK